MLREIFDGFIKSLKNPFGVIPAEAGIQSRLEWNSTAYKYPGLRFLPE
jgi:hypothetical protein